jgi:hypothetical protein
MKYLEKPCTRCRDRTVIPPLKIDLDKPIILVKCQSCKKTSRYNVVDTKDGQTYYLSPVGRKGRGYVRQSWWVPVEYAGMSADEHRAALDSWHNR